MYFPFFKLKKWGEKTVETRRRNCAVLPKYKRRQFTAVPLSFFTRLAHFSLPDALPGAPLRRGFQPVTPTL